MQSARALCIRWAGERAGDGGVRCVAVFMIAGVVLTVAQGLLSEVGIFRLNAVQPYRTIFTLCRIVVSACLAVVAYHFAS